MTKLVGDGVSAKGDREVWGARSWRAALVPLLGLKGKLVVEACRRGAGEGLVVGIEELLEPLGEDLEVCLVLAKVDGLLSHQELLGVDVERDRTHLGRGVSNAKGKRPLVGEVGRRASWAHGLGKREQAA